MRLQQRVLSAAMFAAALVVSTTANATPLSFTTVFGNVPGPTPSAADPGALAADVGSFPSAGVLGAIDNFTNFAVQNLDDAPFGASANTGQIVFFQNGGFYVGGGNGPSGPPAPGGANPLTPQGEANLGGPVVNNRAYGVFGTGRSDIVFDTGVVTAAFLQARGTEAGLAIGSNPALGQSLPEGTLLADANATLQIYTNLGLQVTTSVDNDSFETLSLELGATIDGQVLNGDSIARISLINQGDTNSAIVLGELTVNTQGVDVNGLPIPEPTSLALLGLVAGVATIGCRR